MFLNLENRKPEDLIGVDSSDAQLTSAELTVMRETLADVLDARAVVFVLCNNTVGSLAAYLNTVMLDAIPVMLSSKTDAALLEQLYQVYTPAFVWLPETDTPFFADGTAVFQGKGYQLLRTPHPVYAVHPELELLMTTSGSTGSPKLVRYRRGNLEANAKNVAKAFGWTAAERPLCDLAMNYTMGLNVVNTHIYAGAAVYLTHENIMSAPYWDFIKKYQLTNLTEVPFGYELMLKLRFTRMDLPFLTTLSQGGGKLPDKTFRTLAEFAEKSGKHKGRCAAVQFRHSDALAEHTAGHAALVFQIFFIFLVDLDRAEKRDIVLFQKFHRVFSQSAVRLVNDQVRLDLFQVSGD